MANPDAALIIIGDEVLSGRTLDANTQHIAKTFGEVGIDLKEVRVIPDNRQKIIDTVNAMRAEYKYVFTTGGIGPTHDDITAEAIAAAFDTKLELHEKAYFLLEEYYGKDNLNEGRKKMAYIPVGGELIPNPVSVAPGFIIENVHVMAGVPKIMQGMLENIIPTLEKGTKIISKTIVVESAESKIADILGIVNDNNAEVAIGSYPFMLGNDYKHVGVNVVFRSGNEALLDAAISELEILLNKREIIYKSA